MQHRQQHHESLVQQMYAWFLTQYSDAFPQGDIPQSRSPLTMSSFHFPPFLGTLFAFCFITSLCQITLSNDVTFVWLVCMQVE